MGNKTQEQSAITQHARMRRGVDMIKKSNTEKIEKKEPKQKTDLLSIFCSTMKEEGESERGFRKRMMQDLKQSSTLMSRDEARYLIDTYYQIQDFRIISNNQIQSLQLFGEPSSTLTYFAGNFESLENQLKILMGFYSSQYSIGSWLQSICGIGPVLSAAFLVTFAPISIDRNDKNKTVKCTAGSWYAHAGIAPGIEWNKGEKRPFNARAKVFCFKAGESFVKTQNSKSDFYGKLYAAQKLYYAEKNERGEFAEEAKSKLEKYKIGKGTDAYKAYSNGRLPKAHIHAMARRYAVKIFLSHMHDLVWEDYFGTKAPCPYVFSDKFKGGVHKHFIEIPNRDSLSGRPIIELWGTEEQFLERRKKREEILEAQKKKKAESSLDD
jgi:hypothetical protein